MDLGNLKTIKNLIDEELELYSVLNNQFEEKRKILVSNSVDELLVIDEKILNTVDSIKSSVNHRQILSNKFGIQATNLTQMISLVQSVDKELANEFKSTQIKINNLINEIAHKERIIKELLRHGMNIVNKTLNMISSAASIAGDYNNHGQSVQNEIGRISSIVEEV